MPLYEYQCADCDTRFEALRPMSKADDPIQCQYCESSHTARALSMFAAHVKGGSGGSSTSTNHSSGGGGCGGCNGGSCGHCHH